MSRVNIKISKNLTSMVEASILLENKYPTCHRISGTIKQIKYKNSFDTSGAKAKKVKDR